MKQDTRGPSAATRCGAPWELAASARIPRRRHAARSVCWDQSPPRWRPRAARRGRAIPAGGPQARTAEPARHRDGPRRWPGGGREFYIVSDFLDGPDLGQWLRENRPAWPEAAWIAAAVVDALAHAHARLIVHRDVKPATSSLRRTAAPCWWISGLGSTRRGQAGLNSEHLRDPVLTWPRRAGHNEPLPARQRQGRHDEARAALVAVYNTYTEGFTTPDLADAAATLETRS